MRQTAAMKTTSLTKSAWRKRIHAQQNSGLSIARYCAQHGLSKSSFYLWRKRLSATGADGVPMVEVIAKSSPTRSSPSLVAGARDGCGDGCGNGCGVIEVVLPGAVVIRVDDRVPVARLREVIVMLRDVVEVRS
jgi:hypothetical protein